MAKTKAAAPVERQVKARVLTPCLYGEANDVVTLSAGDAEQAQTDGLVDTTPEAVAYAESLVVEEPAE